MKYDYKTCYEKNAEFYNTHPFAKRLLLLADKGLTYLFGGVYLGLWAYGVSANLFTIRQYALLFAVPVLALLLVSILRLAIRRPRPYSEKGADITPLKIRDGDDNTSFPSRHLTCACVISTLFFAYCPPIAIVLSVMSVLLGYTRFALGLHYPSDLFAGGGLGILCGLLIFL